MPKPPLLPRLISLVTSEEQKKYEKWIEMNTVENTEIHILWFKTLFQKLEKLNFPEKVGQSLLNSWWEAQFPDNKTMAAVTQTLCRHTEDFFAYQLQEKYPERKQVDLVFALLLRGASSLFLKYYNRELKRFRTRRKMRVDFRYWLNYSQLLFVGYSWQLENIGAKKLRGIQPFSHQELSLVLDTTVTSYSLERSLYKLEVKEANTSPLEKYMLQDARKNLAEVSPQVKAVLILHDWYNYSGIPKTEKIKNDLAHFIEMSTFSGKDLSKTILGACYNRLGEWQKRAFRPELRLLRVKVYQAYLSVDIVHFNEALFLALVKLYCEWISSTQHRTSIHPSSERQARVAYHIASVKQELHPLILNMKDSEQEMAIRVMETYLAFESEDNDKMNELLLAWTQTRSVNIAYEAGIRWIKAKYLFLARNEEDLFYHTKNLVSFLQTHVHKKSMYSYFTSLRVSAQFIRRISTSLRKGRSTLTLKKRLKGELFIEDRDWLLAQLETIKP